MYKEIRKMQIELHRNNVYQGVELLLPVPMLFLLAIPKCLLIFKENFYYTSYILCFRMLRIMCRAPKVHQLLKLCWMERGRRYVHMQCFGLRNKLLTTSLQYIHVCV